MRFTEETILAIRLGVFILLLCSQLPSSSKAAAHIEQSGSATTDRLFDIRLGDTVSTVLLRHGFGIFNRDRLIAESGMPSDFRLVPHEHYLVSSYVNKPVTEVRFFEAHKDATYVFWHDHRKSAGGETQVIPLETRTKEISGRVLGSIISSILSFIPNNWVATRFMDAYAFDTDATRDLQRGARFGLRVEEKFWKGRFLKYGEITKTSLELNGRPQDRHFIRLDGGGIFIDEDLHGQRRPLYSPVTYMRISSPFQTNRYHPIRKRIIAHLGTDFELPWGTPVFSAQDGRISKLGRDRASGYYVVIQHMSGFQSSYSHLSHMPKNLFVGAHIRAGQTVGEVGCTGYCTMPHLHFAVKRYGQWMNPIFVIKGYPQQFEGQVLERASQIRKKIARKD